MTGARVFFLVTYGVLALVGLFLAAAARWISATTA